MNTKDLAKKNNPLFLLLFPPVLFLIVIVIFSVYFGAQAQGQPGQTAGVIAEKTAAAAPYILLSVQVILLGILIEVFRRQGLTFPNVGWRVNDRQKWWKELLTGALFGAPLGGLWIFVIEPVFVNIQRLAGDYVPAGSLFPALGAAMIPFAIADIVFAPFVEENIYRGYGFTKLLPRFGAVGTVIITSLLFGLFHWSGGVWYILTTGLLVGVPLAILRNWRGNLWSAFGAHLALNIAETVLLWMIH